MTEQKKKNTKKQQKKKGIRNILVLEISGIVLVCLIVVYVVGRINYSKKFNPNTFINDIDVGGMTFEETKKRFMSGDNDNSIKITKRDGSVVNIGFSDFDYKYDIDNKIQELMDKQGSSAWFMGFMAKSDYSIDIDPLYNEDKLKELIRSSDWGNVKNENAGIEDDGNKYIIRKSVQGDEINLDMLQNYIIDEFTKKNFSIDLVESGCYIKPSLTEDDVKETCDTMNKIRTMTITYDFDYTTETLDSETIAEMISMNEKNGGLDVDEDLAMKYVESLAEKYDTFNKKRKFHATKQGDIVIPSVQRGAGAKNGADGLYGWWIDQEKTCNALVEMIKKAETVDNVDPIYYVDGSYEYTGVESVRTEDDDIGDTYGEIDLRAQHFWYYEKGELKYDCDIVSGQYTGNDCIPKETRATLPGVYKLYDKETNKRLKDTNADGEAWDTQCDYWNAVSPHGIGLHDTKTRTAYGGQIYRTIGSHACINMPLNAARWVYENVEIGTPIVMYYCSCE